MASQMCTEQQENSNSVSAAELIAIATESEPKVTKETPRQDKTLPIGTGYASYLKLYYVYYMPEFIMAL